MTAGAVTALAPFSCPDYRSAMSSTSTAPTLETEAFQTYLRAREAARQADLEGHRQRALGVARAAAAMLRADFGATDVVLFGSLARGGRVSWRSDADVAAWGIAYEDYLRAVGRLQGLDPAVSVDLVRMEEAPERLKAVIEAEGQPL
jgi:predicted nucleotidyltransferase